MYEVGTLEFQVGYNRVERPYGAEGEAPSCWLPHSCDEWVIGGVAEARALIADLERFKPLPGVEHEGK